MTVIGADTCIAGRYRLLELIGSGGMGSVWRAEDEILRRPVAVKLLKEEFAADEKSRARFRVEAQAAASINHPNVVGVFDYGEQGTAGGECLSFVVMEYVEGRSLADALAERGRLPASTVASIVEQTALGLAAAHSRGVIHRDVKPANLLLARNGVLKIGDFGIARVADAVPLTRTGTMLGTAQYVSPEQASGASATPASDLYSLGVVAYACLAGHPPFDGENAVATAVAHMQDPAPPLPADTPPGLRQLVMQMLEKRPGDRPASGKEVAARAQSRTATIRPDPALTEVLPYPAAGSTGILSRPAAAVTRHRKLLVAVPVVAAIAALIAFSLPAGATPKVPNVDGSSVAAAKALLTRDGFRPVVHTVDAANHPAGVVLAQSPAAGHDLSKGRPVLLTVASGNVSVDPTSYVGQQYNAVQSALKALGLTASASPAYSNVPVGSVLSVTPSGEVPVGSTVTVQVAATPPPDHGHHGPGGGGPGGDGGGGGGG